MAYLLNGINLLTYGIIPSHAKGSNIAMAGIWDMPERLGECYHSWFDENGIEPYVDASEIKFAGRDIEFTGIMQGSNTAINTYLKTLYDAIDLFTGLVVFSTPYGNFNVQVKEIVPERLYNIASVVITFREPVVTIAGTLPSKSISNYQVDGLTMLSLGLYYSKGNNYSNLPELSQQLFTKYGAEGYQMSKRKNREFEFNGFIVGSSIADFQSKISALYALFALPGIREINLNDELYIYCFAINGFKVDNIIYGEKIIANFTIELIMTSNNYVAGSSVTSDSIIVTADSTEITVDQG